MSTNKQVLDRAIELFTLSRAWPDATVESTLVATCKRRANLCELDYLAFQSTNFAIMACSDGKWPPMLPSTFVDRVLSQPRMEVMFPKFVNTVREQMGPTPGDLAAKRPQ